MLSRQRLDTAARMLLAGLVIAYPTESVYGLGCRADDPEAIARIIALKGRSAAKGLILIAADIAQIEPLVELPNGPLRGEILGSWPGPVTWVLPARAGTQALLTGDRDTLAVRITAHPAARYLARRVGLPLVSTSANRSGRRPARSALEVRRWLGPAVDHVHSGPLGDRPRPTAIRDGRSGAILRSG